MSDTKLTPQQQRAVDLLRDSGPLMASDVAKMAGWRANPTACLLSKTGKKGAIAKTGSGSHYYWHVPEHRNRARAMLRKLKAEIRSASLARKREYWRACKAKQRETETKQRETESRDWAESTPVHRCIRAIDAPPIVTSAPASVFDLARTVAA